MYVVKIKDKYVHYGDDALIYKVDSPDEATKLHTLKITEVLIKDLKRKNYSDVTYEEMR